MTKTDAGFVILGMGCLLLAGTVEYHKHQDKKTKNLAEQTGISPQRYKKLEEIFVRRADKLLAEFPQHVDPHWGITGGRTLRQGKTFFIELNVSDAPAFQGAGGNMVKRLLPYTHPNTLGLFFSEKGLCQTSAYRFINSDVTIRYNFEKDRESKNYVRSLNSLCGWTQEKTPEKDIQAKNKQLADFAFLHNDLRKGFYLSDASSQSYQTYTYTVMNKDLIPSIHFIVTSMGDSPGVLKADYLWRHIGSHALCEQLSHFDKLPLTMYANVNAISGMNGSVATHTIKQLCQ